MEEVEGSLGFRRDVREMVLGPGPGEGLDFAIAGSYAGVCVWEHGRGFLGVRGDEIGLVVFGHSIDLLLWNAASRLSTAVYEARHLHHDLNGFACSRSVSLDLLCRRTLTALHGTLLEKAHFSW